MVRLKFLVYALLVLALWAGQIYLVAPALSARAAEQAAAQSQAAAHVLGVRLADRRVEILRVALEVASSSKTPAALKSGVAEVAALAKGAAPEPMRPGLIVGVADESSGAFAGADGAPVEKRGVEPALSQAGALGTVQDVEGRSYLFFSFAAVGADGVPTRVVVGAPVMPDGAFDAAAAQTRLAGIALVKGGKLVAEGGAEKN